MGPRHPAKERRQRGGQRFSVAHRALARDTTRDTFVPNGVWNPVELLEFWNALAGASLAK
jgi:hypothetical protein